MTQKTRTLTRRELYELVWSKPIQKVAAEFGVSDRGLGKICKRHRVPNPPRGYWAKVAAGEKPKRPLYREVKDPSLDRIVITSQTAGLPEETKELIREVKAERVSRRGQRREKPVDAIDSEFLDKPYKAVAATARVLRKKKIGDKGLVEANGPGLCGVAVAPDRVERAVHFLHRLAISLDAEGLTLIPDGHRMSISIGQDSVHFTLTERTKRQPHEPTDEERAAHERRQAQRSRAHRLQGWSAYDLYPYVKPWPEFDYIQSGLLVFAIDAYGNGLRKTWADGKTQTVQSMLDDIVVGLKVFLAHKKAEREQSEERERQWEELRRRRELLKRRKAREEKRVAYLRELIDLQREAADIRTWLATLPKTATTDLSTELGRMIAWAHDRLERLEAQTTVDAASAKLDDVSLFPELDDLEDPLGDPPETGYYW